MSHTQNSVRTNNANINSVRIIGGKWKRSRLAIAPIAGLRPTPDRVRETLFNWLGQDLTGWRCIDAFAGTGALGLEAASRGAASVILIEQDKLIAKTLLTHIERLEARPQVVLRQSDALSCLSQLHKSPTPQANNEAAGFDLIFLDPPYANTALYTATLPLAAQLLAPTGVVYLEAQQEFSEDQLTAHGLSMHRHLKAGQVHAHLLKLSAQP